VSISYDSESESDERCTSCGVVTQCWRYGEDIIATLPDGTQIVGYYSACHTCIWQVLEAVDDLT
jgi:hypothetical protein